MPLSHSYLIVPYERSGSKKDGRKKKEVDIFIDLGHTTFHDYGGRVIILTSGEETDCIPWGEGRSRVNSCSLGYLELLQIVAK